MVGVVCAVAAPLLLAAGWTVAAGLQPRSFNPVAGTVSALAAVGAADRWVMTLAFAAAGACEVITGLALRPAAAPGRLILMAGGLAGVLVAANPEHAGGSLAHACWAGAGFAALVAWPGGARRRGPSVPWGLRPAVSSQPPRPDASRQPPGSRPVALSRHAAACAARGPGRHRDRPGARNRPMVGRDRPGRPAGRPDHRPHPHCRRRSGPARPARQQPRPRRPDPRSQAHPLPRRRPRLPIPGPGSLPTPDRVVPRLATRAAPVASRSRTALSCLSPQLSRSRTARSRDCCRSPANVEECRRRGIGHARHVVDRCARDDRGLAGDPVMEVSAQLAQERVVRLVRRYLDPRVHHVRPVRPGDDRVEVEFGDLGQVVGEP